MRQILFKILYCLLVVIPGVGLSQVKIYLSSESGYVSVISVEDWIENDLSVYAGKYEYIYPGQLPSGEYAGDGMLDEFYFTFNNGEIKAHTLTQVEGWVENMGETLYSPVMNSNKLSSYNCQGKFALVKFKTNDGKIKSTSGLFLTCSAEDDGNFYEKVKSGSGGMDQRNSLMLLGNEMVFGMTIDDFKEKFQDFKPEANDFFFGTNGEGYELLSIRKENLQDNLKSHLIVAKFKNNKLSCLELHGQNEEISGIRSKLLSQMTLYDRKITNDELQIETVYYMKDDLKAELIEFEFTLLSICFE